MQADHPNEALRDAFDAQATTEALDKVIRAAGARMRVYTPRRQTVDPADAEDMVMGVIADTLDGSLSWAYVEKPLLQHLLDAVRYRARDEARKRWRAQVQHVPIDEEVGDDTSIQDARLVTGVLARPDRAHDARQITDGIVSDLRLRFAGDGEVEMLFEAMVGGAYERAEILEETGLSAGAYRNARRRLDRILLDLPPTTRSTVLSTFSNQE